MKLSDLFTSRAIAANWTEAASNAMPYLGTGFFPSSKKAGLDLKWFKGNKGLPVSLMPTAFDAKSTFRDRIGVSVTETEMPFFRESMLVKEADEQEIMRVQDSDDPYANAILERIFDDARTLVDGANVVPERMRMQLLAPIGGNMGITIQANEVDYTYNYDPDGSWAAEHYIRLTGTNIWSDTVNADPIQDLEDALDAQEAASGNRPTVALMSKATFRYMKNSEKVRNGILAMAGVALVNMTDARVREYVAESLGLTIVVYAKKYKDEAGVDHNFYPDNIVMLMPSGAVGRTWYGTTPEERTLSQRSDVDVSVVNTGVAVAVVITEDPVHTKTTCSEIVLPSFERADECYAIEVI